MSQIAGWYPDPAGVPGRLRWWNGTSWTEHTTDPAPSPAPEPVTPRPETPPEAVSVPGEDFASLAALFADEAPTAPSPLPDPGFSALAATAPAQPPAAPAAQPPAPPSTPLGTPLGTPLAAPPLASPRPPVVPANPVPGAQGLASFALEPLEIPAPLPRTPEPGAPATHQQPTEPLLLRPQALDEPIVPAAGDDETAGFTPVVVLETFDDTPVEATTDPRRRLRHLMLVAIVIVSLALVVIGVLGVLESRAGASEREKAIAAIQANGQLRDQRTIECFVDHLHDAGMSYARLASEHTPSPNELSLASAAMLACQPAATTQPR